MESLSITIDNQDFVVICLPNRPKALLDRTVANIYKVPTKRVNEAVKRNPEKFPEDFCFDLTFEELDRIYNNNECCLKNELVANCDQFNNLKHSHVLPKAFTHFGCNMLATILKSPKAIQRAIQIIRTFSALESGNLESRNLEGRILALERSQEEIQRTLVVES